MLDAVFNHERSAQRDQSGHPLLPAIGFLELLSQRPDALLQNRDHLLSLEQIATGDEQVDVEVSLVRSGAIRFEHRLQTPAPGRRDLKHTSRSPASVLHAFLVLADFADKALAKQSV